MAHHHKAHLNVMDVFHQFYFELIIARQQRAPILNLVHLTHGFHKKKIRARNCRWNLIIHDIGDRDQRSNRLTQHRP